jgi:hypothetical protein
VIENLSAELYLGEEATGASCMTSGGQWSGGHGGGGAPSLTGGVSWGFDSKKKVRVTNSLIVGGGGLTEY